MEAGNIPDDLKPEGFDVITVGAPKGRESEIRPCEAAVGIGPFGPEMRLLIRFDPEDIMEVVNQVTNEIAPHFWLCILGQSMPPIRFESGRVAGDKDGG